MLTRLDQHLIKRHAKHRGNALNRFLGSKRGFIFTTLLALYQTITELIDTVHEGNTGLSIVFSAIMVLLLSITVRHIILYKRIVHYEYWLKLLEAGVILYIGLEKCHSLGVAHGYGTARGMVLFICTIGTALLYCGAARVFYLINKGVIADGHAGSAK